MSSADWEEIRLLAADFQRAQLSSTIQRLSERNCIEIVNKLLEFNLIEVLYTQDGKEYLTPSQLMKDIKDELFVRGGRVSLGELQQLTNVDYTHVENSVKDIVSTDRQNTLVLGDLINEDYLRKVAEEINDKLQENGHVTIAELTKTFDLPGELLSEVIQRNLGRIIKAQRDDSNPDYLYTESAVLRHKAKLRGVFSALTKPVSLSNIRSKVNAPKDLFHGLLETLISEGRIHGSLYGGRTDKATFTPDIYTRSQNDWVDSFYSCNGYLEYTALARLGLSDPKAFIRRRYGDTDLKFLDSCCVGPNLCAQLTDNVEEAMSQKSWIDILPLLPSSFTESDASLLLTDILKTHPTSHVLCDSIIVSADWLNHCQQSFDQLVTSKAEKDAISNPSLFHSEPVVKKASQSVSISQKDQKKEMRRKKASAVSKSGSGTQGREVKTKSTKKKTKQSKHLDENSDDESSQQLEIEFLSIKELQDILKEREDMAGVPEEMVTEISTLLYRPLSKLYQERATAIFLQSTGSATGQDRRKTHEELQEKIVALWINAKMFEKGIQLFSSQVDLEPYLVKHLLKTVCTTITNAVIVTVATEHMLPIPQENTLLHETRQKLISSISEPSKSVLSELNQSLNAKNVQTFFESLDVVCGPKHLGIMLKNLDKKRERSILQTHRQTLLAQLETETDPALTLHACVALLLLHHEGIMVHAPGRCIPILLAHLLKYMEVDDHSLLTQLQDLIVQHLKTSDDLTDEKQSLLSDMSLLLPSVKAVASTPKKRVKENESQL